MFWQPFVEALALLTLRLVNTLRAHWGANMQWLVFFFLHTHIGAPKTRIAGRLYLAALSTAVWACRCFGPANCSSAHMLVMKPHWPGGAVCPGQIVKFHSPSALGESKTFCPSEEGSDSLRLKWLNLCLTNKPTSYVPGLLDRSLATVL